ncbi:DEAD/DEAH box helicase [Snuella sedimenti]|uniref:DEAD/DEAH box helicase family protein n=1 Tax=Snuella sedimenti TaxID=2798802 RepID=A0A8J7LNZ3_9FLAO|nr:DEAD/DEAH box helicase family protein [Snuella sedimenti]MBJ6368578.1 DEAD/DEAH box helicase family protein [Snuella sedimenti]
MESLFKETISIDLKISLKKHGNKIIHKLGVKTGEISKYEDLGYLFRISQNEKYFFTFNHNKFPKEDFNAIFYFNINKCKGDIYTYLKTCPKECMSYQFPNDTSVIDSWRGNFNYKQEVLDKNKEPIIKGLRPPQIGSLHSILAHWSISIEPAIVVMPTGTGKTETMLSLAVANLCNKILVIVPSNSLRTQISNKFIELGILKNKDFGVINEIVINPIVGLINTSFQEKKEAVDFYSKCNVIVATTDVITACRKKDVGIFLEIINNSNYLIVDEAHHCAANTWNNIAVEFIKNKKPVLKFTATPFRNDDKRLKGKIIYNYPLSLAQRDGSFREINFMPIVEFDDNKVHHIIAKKAILQLEQDIENGLEHLLMARVDKIEEAKKVFEIYKSYQKYNPVLITSETKDKEKREILSRLRSESNPHKVIVCVNMLGEGYDLPELKICALHIMHKNITTSIQFFGRFTRSSTKNVGNATIIANIGDNKLKDNLLKKLYAKDADWNRILKTSNESILSDLNKEEAFFQKFDEDEIPYKIPLRNIAPALSTVVYQINSLSPKWKPENHKDFFESRKQQSVFATHQEKNLIVIITKSDSTVRWGKIDDLININYDLFIIYYNEEQKLLFINSSNNGSLYGQLANDLIGDEINLINEADIYKSLHEVEELELFNLGVKPISEESISYTQLFGKNVGEALDEITKQTKSSANLFGKGFSEGERMTIGCSSKGRVWSRMVKTIPEFCDWCDVIGGKLINTDIDVKNIFDFIAKPERVPPFPDDFLFTPISIIWNDDIYYRESELFINNESFYDYRIDLDIDNSNKSKIVFSVSDSYDRKTLYELTLDSNKKSRGFSYQKISGADLVFKYGKNEYQSIQEFFTAYPPIIRFADSSKMYNDIFFKFKYKPKGYDVSKIKTKDWKAYGVNITIESQYDKTKTILRKDSIQYVMINELKNDSNYQVVFDDDDKNEVSDIIAIKYYDDYSKLVVDLYHCKFSLKDKAGARLKDLYEVCGQAQRSFHWKHNMRNLIEHIKKREAHRLKNSKPSRFEKGGNEELQTIINMVESGMSKIVFNVIIVQPGISKKIISDEQLSLLGATDMLLKNTGNNFEVLIDN